MTKQELIDIIKEELSIVLEKRNERSAKNWGNKSKKKK